MRVVTVAPKGNGVFTLTTRCALALQDPNVGNAVAQSGRYSSGAAFLELGLSSRLFSVDGVHDLGGKLGFGDVTITPHEPTFQEPWEATVWALNVLAIGTLRAYKSDTYRHAVERMEPMWYLRARYYERTLSAVATLLVERGLASLDDLQERAGGRIPLPDPVATLPALQSEDTVATQPRFEPGDAVVVIAKPTPGHTRCPAYVRGRRGVVRRVYPLAYYPELRAHSTVKRREHSYAIEFEAGELWAAGDRHQSVLVELFESYLDRP